MKKKNIINITDKNGLIMQKFQVTLILFILIILQVIIQYMEKKFVMAALFLKNF